MKKTFSFYMLIWLVCLAVFNVLTFVIPAMPDFPKFTTMFWLGYGFVTLVFVVQLVLFLLFSRKHAKNTAEKTFLNVPVIRMSFTALIVCTTVGSILMAISIIPAWIAIVACTLTLAICIIPMLGAKVAVSEVERVGNEVEAKTDYMRKLSMNASVLQNVATTPELRTLTKKVCEAVRYSDFVSSPSLTTIEEELSAQFQVLESAVKAGNPDEATSAAEQFLALLQSRNIMCKALKK